MATGRQTDRQTGNNNIDGIYGNYGGNGDDDDTTKSESIFVICLLFLSTETQRGLKKWGPKT